jgi:hypothetical protein
MKNKLLSILRDSRFYLILGGVILVISVFGASFTFNPKIKALTIRDDYDDCIASPWWANADRTVFTFPMMKEYCVTQAVTLPPGTKAHWSEYYRMYRNIFFATATLGALMFIYGLAMQRRQR